MEYNLLYFSIFGANPSETTAWSGIILEDGEMDSLVGSSPSEFEAILEGLQVCLERLPTGTLIVIRSRDRNVLQLGRSWLQNWLQHGWEEEVHSAAISGLMLVLENRQLEWFAPSFMDDVDRTVLQYAKDEWNYNQALLSKNTEQPTPDDSPSILDVPSEEPTPSEVPVSCDEGTSIEENTQEDLEETNASNQPSSAEEDEVTVPSSEIITPKEEPLSAINSEANTLAPEASPLIEALRPSSNYPLEEGAITEQPTRTPNSNSTATTQTQTMVAAPNEAQNEHRIPDSLETDRLRYPYIDDEGLQQIAVLFEQPEQEEERNRPLSRMIGYIHAIGSHHHGAWSFAIIDRPSQNALFSVKGSHHSNLYRAFLQGTHALLSSIRNPKQLIEIRVANPALHTLIATFIQDPYSSDVADIWSEEFAYISQLSMSIEITQVEVRLLDSCEQNIDRAYQEVCGLCHEALNNLNSGLPAVSERRRANYPLHTLVN